MICLDRDLIITRWTSDSGKPTLGFRCLPDSVQIKVPHWNLQCPKTLIFYLLILLPKPNPSFPAQFLQLKIKLHRHNTAIKVLLDLWVAVRRIRGDGEEEGRNGNSSGAMLKRKAVNITAYVRESECGIEFWVAGHYIVIDSLSQAGEVLHGSFPVLHQDLWGKLAPKRVQRISVCGGDLHKHTQT